MEGPAPRPADLALRFHFPQPLALPPARARLCHSQGGSRNLPLILPEVTWLRDSSLFLPVLSYTDARSLSHLHEPIFSLPKDFFLWIVPRF